MPHLALILALGAGGCQARDIVPGVDDSTFVRTMADLRRVQTNPSLADSAARAAARAAALKRHGMTAEQLERAARSLATDPERAQALFRAVNKATGAAADSSDIAPARSGSGAARRRAL